MSFLLPNPLPGAASGLLGEACVASVGYHDQTPGPTSVHVAGGLLTVHREEDESGYLMIPWPVAGAGPPVVITTATLRERVEPYRLLVELARGKLNQVRTQAAEWHSIGLRTPAAFDAAVVDASREFGRAALAPTPDEADAQAAAVLARAHALADQLAREYVAQMFATRKDSEGPLDTRLAARYVHAPQKASAAEYGRAFNAAALALRWRDIEPVQSEYDWAATDAAVAFAVETGLPVTVGPVIDFSPGFAPAWVEAEAADLPTLAACLCDFLETALNRYKGDVRRWVVCAGLNHADAHGLGGDDRLRLAYRLFEAAAQVDSGLELVLSVSQPWGEYLAGDGQTLSPLTFPDDLMRAGVRLSAVELEVRPNVRPRGSLPRDLLDTARLFDVFGMLGLPLEVVLSWPGSDAPDRAAEPHGQTVWAAADRSRPPPEWQADWGAAVAALAVSWPQVRSVTWDHWWDGEPHLIPHGGLLDPSGRPKPLLGRLRTLCTAHLASGGG